MKELFIFANLGLYDPERKDFAIGGLETYARDLALLGLRLGYHPVCIEMNNQGKDEAFPFGDIEFRRVSSARRKYRQDVFDRVFRENDKPGNVFVLMVDHYDVKSKSNHTIVIDHGIAFDEPMPGRRLGRLVKLAKCMKNVWRWYLAPNSVNVDYNYFNWFRTLDTIPQGQNFRVIPNYTQGSISRDQLNEKLARSTRRKMVFARRFVDYRGTKIFAEATCRLLVEFSDLDVTFAGGGELKPYLEEKFKGEPRVHLTSYHSSESLAFHKSYDIAVVPTIFSEGTSLSLLEAMAAGCLPVATHVGGLTNILIDGYNGRLCFPSEEGVYRTLKEVLEMPGEAFGLMAQNAWQTAVQGFSKEKWKKAWTEFLLSVAERDL